MLRQRMTLQLSCSNLRLFSWYRTVLQLLPGPCHRYRTAWLCERLLRNATALPCRAASFNRRSDPKCDQTSVDTANIEAEQSLRITKPYSIYQSIDQSDRAAIEVSGEGGLSRSKVCCLLDQPDRPMVAGTNRRWRDFS